MTFATQEHEMTIETIKRNAPIGVPTSYRGCIIVPVGDGFDVVDKATGRWMHVANQRTAKWNATVWTRLRDEFETRTPLATLPTVQAEIAVRKVVTV
jgi:hypothetical protein